MDVAGGAYGGWWAVLDGCLATLYHTPLFPCLDTRTIYSVLKAFGLEYIAVRAYHNAEPNAVSLVNAIPAGPFLITFYVLQFVIGKPLGIETGTRGVHAVN